MCAMHLSRKYRHGDPHYTPEQRVLDAAERRFWKLVNKTETCWLWTGRLNHGYGYFRVTILPGGSAHRFAWRVMGRGEIPVGMQLDHLCRVRNCVNPDHLE